jgi:seryl-tRNA synthetase
MNAVGFHSLSDGRVALSGRALDECRRLDDVFALMARDDGASETMFPSLLSRATLERSGYFESFPDGAMGVTCGENREAQVLAPAVCYHCYAAWAGLPLDGPRIVTCVGRCFREEPAGFDPPARLREFTMREVVFAGAPGWVVERRRAWMQRVEAFARSLELDATMELANDPFFGGQARGRQLLQRLKELKYELRVRVAGLPEPLAVASFNLHETHFTDRFEIALTGGATAHTGCVAFGIERWALAVTRAKS